MVECVILDPGAEGDRGRESMRYLREEKRELFSRKYAAGSRLWLVVECVILDPVAEGDRGRESMRYLREERRVLFSRKYAVGSRKDDVLVPSS